MVLLELMVALTIFAVVSLGLVTALDRAFSVEGDRHAADDAVRGLRNQFVLLHGQPLVLGEHELTNDASDISYHLSVAPEPMLDQRKQPVIGVYRATITARWKAGRDTESRAVSTLIYQP
jgi:hypothetical protein